ncbi:DUF6303 family protein [Streptomyces sp. NPDC018031]|uniref:DUF6303 family protein n=1 Tax=Streptomyces sp. NPDC018031 TaxID=3365033 RepID=UPI0037B9E168
MALTAQCSANGGEWRVYVVLLGEPEWPEFRWPRTAPVPTTAERQEALAALGYESVPGSKWVWIEDCATPGDDRSAVWLIARIDVRELPAGGAP